MPFCWFCHDAAHFISINVYGTHEPECGWVVGLHQAYMCCIHHIHITSTTLPNTWYIYITHPPTHKHTSITDTQNTQRACVWTCVCMFLCFCVSQSTSYGYKNMSTSNWEQREPCSQDKHEIILSINEKLPLTRVHLTQEHIWIFLDKELPSVQLLFLWCTVLWIGTTETGVRHTWMHDMNTRCFRWVLWELAKWWRFLKDWASLALFDGIIETISMAFSRHTLA